MLLDLRGMLLNLFESFKVPAAVPTGHCLDAWQQDVVQLKLLGRRAAGCSRAADNQYTGCRLQRLSLAIKVHSHGLASLLVVGHRVGSAALPCSTRAHQPLLDS